jgi:cytochrome c-type protein NapC
LWYFVVAGASLLAGLAIAAVYASVLDYTSTLNFCAHSCHEMESTVYEEYTHSRHFRNPEGIVVVCSDCHVPHHNWPATLAVKVAATFNELIPHFADRLYIKERFDALRPQLAKNEWARFAADNAHECKSCHKYRNMVLADQRTSVRAQHADAMKTDENCLDCHKGITHKNFAESSKKPSSESFDLP